jgi:hypothetical protein
VVVKSSAREYWSMCAVESVLSNWYILVLKSCPKVADKT